MSDDQQASPEDRDPYAVLAGTGLSPQSSMRAVRDASYQLMQEEGRWAPEVRAAWDELRIVERRLVVDFLTGGATVEAGTAGGVLEVLLGRQDAAAVEYDR